MMGTYVTVAVAEAPEGTGVAAGDPLAGLEAAAALVRFRRSLSDSSMEPRLALPSRPAGLDDALTSFACVVFAQISLS